MAREGALRQLGRGRREPSSAQALLILLFLPFASLFVAWSGSGSACPVVVLPRRGLAAPARRARVARRAASVFFDTPFSPEDNERVLQALRKERLPMNRRPVAYDGRPELERRGCTIGLTQDYASGLAVPTTATRKRPELAKALTEACRNADPNFRYTSIQVNLNAKYRMHTDGFDAGASRMFTLGNFTRGRMWLHDWDAGDWQAVDCRDRWIAFDGREFHLTEEWDGPERYSLVYFTHPAWRCETLGPEAREKLEALGFPWPTEADVFTKPMPRPDVRRGPAEDALPPGMLALERELPPAGWPASAAAEAAKAADRATSQRRLGTSPALQPSS